MLFSFSVPFTKVAIEGFDPFLTAMGRAVIAAGLAIVLLAVNRVPFPARRHWTPLALTALGAVFGWPILLALALERTTSAHAAVIAAFMPLATAIFAVLLTGERVTRTFWLAAAVGTGALVVFAALRGGLEGGGLVADLLIVGAVLASSLCYVLGASVTKAMPGWQVISWVVVIALPITFPATVVLWSGTHDAYDPGVPQWGALLFLGISSMYLAFFAWYRGLAEAGIAYGGQVQQLQAPLSLLWAALLLGEVLSWSALLVAAVVVLAVSLAQRSRAATVVAPEE